MYLTSFAGSYPAFVTLIALVVIIRVVSLLIFNYVNFQKKKGGCMNKIWNLICLTIGCLTESVWAFLISVTSSGSQLTSLQDLLGLVKYIFMRCRVHRLTPHHIALSFYNIFLLQFILLRPISR